MLTKVVNVMTKRLEKKLAGAKAAIVELDQAKAKAAEQIGELDQKIETAGAGQIAALAREKAAKLAELNEYSAAYDAQLKRRDQLAAELQQKGLEDARAAQLKRKPGYVEGLEGVIATLTKAQQQLEEMEGKGAEHVNANMQKFGQHPNGADKTIMEITRQVKRQITPIPALIRRHIASMS